MGLKFAIRGIPMYRRRQMLAVAIHVFSVPLFMSFFLLCCAFPPFWPILAIYLIYVSSDTSYEDGTSMSQFAMSFRTWRIWKHFANFFPIVLHKTCDLAPAFIQEGSTNVARNNAGTPRAPPLVWKITFWWYYYFLKPREPVKMVPTGTKYLFGYHPHGIIGMGLIGGIASDGAGWSKLFPGIPVRALTLKSNFRLPFYREYLKSLGLASVARDSCNNLLANNQPICIVIGGAQESLQARPGTMDLVLNRRRGFIKLAIHAEGDVNVVPIIAFGENDLYDQVETGGRLAKFQQAVKNKLGFTLPLMHARGVFNYDMGVIPYRRPINIVVGEPIIVPHISYPTQYDVEKYHTMYTAAVQKLFDQNKRLYFKDFTGKNKSADDFKLRIVE